MKLLFWYHKYLCNSLFTMYVYQMMHVCYNFFTFASISIFDFHMASSLMPPVLLSLENSWSLVLPFVVGRNVLIASSLSLLTSVSFYEVFAMKYKYIYEVKSSCEALSFSKVNHIHRVEVDNWNFCQFVEVRTLAIATYLFCILIVY